MRRGSVPVPTGQEVWPPRHSLPRKACRLPLRMSSVMMYTGLPPPTWSDDLDRYEHGVQPQAFPHLPEVAFTQLPPQGELRAGSLPLVLLRGLLRVWGALRAFACGSLGRVGSCSRGPRPLAPCPCAPAHAQPWRWPGQGPRC